MYHPQNPPTVDITLIFRYDGIKATQYFAKWSSESDQVFRSDLLALKLPHPKRENTNLVSYGYVQCVWPSAANQGALHKQIVSRADLAGLQKLRELSIVNIVVKDSPASTNSNSLKRPQFHISEGAQQHPFKRPKLEGDPYKHSFQNTTDRSGTVDTNPRTTNLPTRATGFTPRREYVPAATSKMEAMSNTSMMATPMAGPSNSAPGSHNRGATVLSHSAQQSTPVVVPIVAETTHPTSSTANRCLVPPQSLPTPPLSALRVSRFSGFASGELARRASPTTLGQQQTPTTAPPTTNTSSSPQSRQHPCPPLSAEELAQLRVCLQARFNISAAAVADKTRPIQRSEKEITAIRAFLQEQLNISISGTLSTSTPVTKPAPVTSNTSTNVIPPRPPSATEIARVRAYMQAKHGPNPSSVVSMHRPPTEEEIERVTSFSPERLVANQNNASASAAASAAPLAVHVQSVIPPASRPTQTPLEPLRHPRSAIPVLNSQSGTPSTAPAQGSGSLAQSIQQPQLVRLHTTTPVLSSNVAHTPASQDRQSVAQLVKESAGGDSQSHSTESRGPMVIDTDVAAPQTSMPISNSVPSPLVQPAQISPSPAPTIEQGQTPSNNPSLPADPSSPVSSSHVAPSISSSVRVSRFLSISPEELARRVLVSNAGQSPDVNNTVVQQQTVTLTAKSTSGSVPIHDYRKDQVGQTPAYSNGQEVFSLSVSSHVNATTTAASSPFVHHSRLPSFSAEELIRTSHQGAEEASAMTLVSQSRASVVAPSSSSSSAATASQQLSQPSSLSTRTHSRTVTASTTGEMRARRTVGARDLTNGAAIMRLTREVWDVKREITASIAMESSIIAQLKKLDPQCNIKGSGDMGAEAEKASDTNNVRVNESFTALGKAHMRILQIERVLDEERKKRQKAEIAIADVRRECRAPFIVPSLLDAFLELSHLTTQATAGPVYPEIPRSYASAVGSDEARTEPSTTVGSNEPIIPVSSSTSLSPASVSVGNTVTPHINIKQEPDDTLA